MLYELVKRLSKQHKIDEYATSSADHAFSDHRQYLRAVEQRPFSPTAARWRSPLGRLNNASRLRDLVRLREIGMEMASVIDRGDYDVVFAHPSRWTQGPAACAYLRTPTVYYIQEPLRALYDPQHDATIAAGQSSFQRGMDRVDPLRALYRRTLRKIDWDAVHGADVCATNSRFTAAWVKDAYGIQPVVCMPGVDIDFFRPPRVIRERAVVRAISVGAVLPAKGQDFLLRALSQVELKCRPELHLVGNAADSTTRATLERLGDELGVRLRIDVGIDDEALRSAYQEASLCVYAPHSEPFGLVPLEAMATGLPVVAVAEGGVLESVEDGKTGRLCPRDELLFAEAVTSLMMDEPLRRSLGAAGRRAAQARWSWEAATERVEHLFAELLASRESRTTRNQVA